MRRSRRLLAVVALYLMVAALLAHVFVHLLEQAQAVVKNPVALMAGANGPGPRGRGGPVFAPSPADKPSQGILFSRGSPFRAVLRNQVSDNDTMDFLVVQPPIALFYLLTSFMFVPFLIMITAAETVAQEHQTRGVRFVAMRTGRAEFVLGKVLGQGLLVALVTGLAGLMGLTIAAWSLADFALGPGPGGPAAVLAARRGLCGALRRTGLALLDEHEFGDVGARLRVARAGRALAHAQAPALYAGSALAPVFNALDYLSPYAYQDDLWRPRWNEIGTPLLLLGWLGVVYVGAAYCFTGGGM